MKINPIKLPRSAIHTATFISWAAIVTLSLIPRPPEILHPFSYSDKLFHTLAYAVLAFFAYQSLFIETYRGKGHRPAAAGTAALLFILLALGTAIEIIQPFVGRSKEILDFAADAIGTAAGLGVSIGLAGRIILHQKEGEPEATNN